MSFLNHPSNRSLKKSAENHRASKFTRKTRDKAIYLHSYLFVGSVPPTLTTQRWLVAPAKAPPPGFATISQVHQGIVWIHVLPSRSIFWIKILDHQDQDPSGNFEIDIIDSIIYSSIDFSIDSSIDAIAGLRSCFLKCWNCSWSPLHPRHAPDAAWGSAAAACRFLTHWTWRTIQAVGP